MAGVEDLATSFDAGRQIGWRDFAALNLRLRDAVMGFAQRYLHEQRDVDAVVKETFVRLFLALPELESEDHALDWSRRTVTNLCIDRYRASQHRSRLPDHELIEHAVVAQDQSTYALMHAEDANLVRHALKLLSPLHREVLVKREIEEKSLSQIAVELDVPEESVKHLLYRARRALRRLLIGVDADTGQGEPLEPMKEERTEETALFKMLFGNAPPADGVRILRAAFERLGEAEQRALHLFYDEQAGFDAIAEQLGFAEDDVQTILKHAVAELFLDVASQMNDQSEGREVESPEVFAALAEDPHLARDHVPVPGTADSAGDRAIEESRLARTVGDLTAVMARAAECWDRDVVPTWLHSRNEFLDGARPVDVLCQRGGDEVMAALEALDAGAFA